MEDVDREISEMKLSLNARARIVAESYLTAVSLGLVSHHQRLIPDIVQSIKISSDYFLLRFSKLTLYMECNCYFYRLGSLSSG